MTNLQFVKKKKNTVPVKHNNMRHGFTIYWTSMCYIKFRNEIDKLSAKLAKKRKNKSQTNELWMEEETSQMTQHKYKS